MESDDEENPKPARSLPVPIIVGIFVGVFLTFQLVTHWLGKPDEKPVATASASPAPAAPKPGVDLASFTPPPVSAIPSGPQGDAIKRGLKIFQQTQIYAKKYVGSGLNCTNCHLEDGRKAEAAPMWAAWVSYPAYRSKNKQINTMQDRIRGCFVYSMNAQDSPAGTPPPYGSDIYRDLEAYFAWLATGAPTGAKMPGRGYEKLPQPSGAFDLAHGKQVFTAQCAACHGANGEGMKDGKGGYTYPPLWGPHSFNWGAGMGKIANAAGFIKVNMPYGNGNSLTDAEAWDVAAYVDSHERPRDPRQKGTTIAATKAAHHKSGSYYGQVVNGHLLGSGP